MLVKVYFALAGWWSHPSLPHYIFLYFSYNSFVQNGSTLYNYVKLRKTTKGAGDDDAWSTIILR